MKIKPPTATKVYGRSIETGGCTAEQLNEAIAYGDELDRLAGPSASKDLLREMYGYASRKELDRDQAEKFISACIARLADAKALLRERERVKRPELRFARRDYRGAHLYEVTADGVVVGKDLRGITTALNVLDKPALLPWIARLTGDAFKSALRRVLLEESPADVAAVRAELLPLLDVDGFKLANEQKGKAADRGTDAHGIAEQIAKNWMRGVRTDDATIAAYVAGTENPAADVYLCALAIREWFDRVQPKILSAEYMVACLHCGIAATLDLHCEIGGVEHVLDVKTSGGVYQSHALQTAYQAHGLEQMARGLHQEHAPVNRDVRIGALWVNRGADQGCELIEFQNTEATLTAAQSAIAAYQWTRKNAWRKRAA